ncbi:arylsulfatase [Sediminibacterium sp. TEGAF015]|uniref:arylsulfatase n=1 Tax=Sediminibacterium sp. TEGAF015 TaxID=575378 RepID=UPI00220A0868|nr:arylsulfatase [Sediminibacterium sp. TEGAF015]BDQ13206.1 arylsulfatase [Sediminibacterium sp. TEGAF015]
MKTVYIFLAMVFMLNKDCLLAQQSKPNIVFILADDLGYGDLGCYGSAQIRTPHIDALAKTGTRFTHFYSGSTVCAPSRASLMTGLHTGHLTVRGNGEVPLPAEEKILPQYLKEAGYTTGIFGKWGLGQSHTTGSPEKKGWDYFSGLLHHVEGHYQQPDSAWKMINAETRKLAIPKQQYSNEWFTNEAKSFIDLHTEKSQNRNAYSPFFLYLSFTLPHAELKVPNAFLALYLDQNGQSIFAPEKQHPTGQHYGEQKFPKAAYAAMVSQMDSYVGEIVEKLKEKNLLENTIIVFTSDNGTHKEGGRNQNDIEYFKSSGIFRGAKRDLYEGGIRVPFIISWKKGFKKPQTQNTIGAFWDILPTFNEIAGIQSSVKTDGISLLNVLKGHKQGSHPPLYWEFYEGGFKQAVVSGSWKAIRYYKGTEPDRTELYNLSSDPSEKNNLSAQLPDKRKEMEMIMQQQSVSSTHPLFQIK